MAKKLKTYLTSLGFFDQAIAAPSMKAALAAWGAESNLFHQGIAREVDDPEIVEATMSRPGVVLKRPVGSKRPFAEFADLPADLPAGDVAPKQANRRRQQKPPRKAIDEKAARKAALAFEKEQKRRDSARRKEVAARERERERRRQAVAKAQAALDAAERDHAGRLASIEDERAALEERARVEEARWRKVKDRLDLALRRARE